MTKEPPDISDPSAWPRASCTWVERMSTHKMRIYNLCNTYNITSKQGPCTPKAKKQKPVLNVQFHVFQRRTSSAFLFFFFFECHLCCPSRSFPPLSPTRFPLRNVWHVIVIPFPWQRGEMRYCKWGNIRKAVRAFTKTHCVDCKVTFQNQSGSHTFKTSKSYNFEIVRDNTCCHS